MKFRRSIDGTTEAFGWMSPHTAVWLWHVLFDGTPLCRCAHSADYRKAVRGEIQ